VTVSMINRLLLSALIASTVVPAARAAEIVYYVTAPPDAPKEEVILVETEDGDKARVLPPVAKLDSKHVQKAEIKAEPVEILVEDKPVTELFYVTFLLDEEEAARIAKAMGDLCKDPKMKGVHIAFEDVIFDYRPFTVCGDFKTSASFVKRNEAERFAKKFTQAVTFVTPAKED